MSIQFGGLASGLPVEDIISSLLAVERRPVDLLGERKAAIELQKGLYGNVKSRVSDLLTSVRKIATTSVLDTNPFQKKIATSSNDTIATATATKNASPQTIDLEVISLATVTRAQSTSPVGQWMTGASIIGDVARQTVTNGTFTVYVNGIGNTINVDTSQNINSVLTQLNGLGLTATVNASGQIDVQKNGNTLAFGGSGDTSNFLKATTLQTGIDSGPAITASSGISTINLTVPVSGASNFNTAVTDGTFTIGGATFDTTGKSLSEIITEINNTSAAGVSASYNATANRVELASKTPGSALITMSDGGSNFLTASGLITGGDSTLSQTAGSNAEILLNGSTVYAPGNTVDEAITGIAGVTLNLKQAQPGTPITITVGADSENLKTLVNDFITKYNAVIDYIDQQTDSEAGGKLAGENQLNRLRQQLRTLVSTGVAGLSGTAYPNLMSVGVSTGAITGTAGAVTAKLQFNAATFDAAMADNPDAVRQLFTAKDLIGTDDGNAGDEDMNGILTQIESLLSSDIRERFTGSGVFVYGALYTGGDNDNGIFAAFQKSADRRIKGLNEAIDRGEERLLRREKLLRQQFTAMESVIAQFQNQGNALTGLSQQLNANGGNN